jgi:double-stranded uracil-DNA glycosylase
MAIAKPFKPTRQQLIDAAGKTLPDVIAPNLRVLFCGINPGLYTAAVGHHFARPGNRFWPALHLSGFTDRLLSPFDERELLQNSIGISNVVAHATASAAELTRDDFIAGGRRLAAKVKRFHRASWRFSAWVRIVRRSINPGPKLVSSLNEFTTRVSGFCPIRVD